MSDTNTPNPGASENASDTPAPTAGNTDTPGQNPADAAGKAGGDDGVQDPPAKTEGDTETKDQADADQDGEAKPIEYQDFTLPEGVELDQVALDAFKPIAAELGIAQEGAQKLVNLYTSQLQSIREADLAADAKAFEDSKELWRKEVQTDPEIGGARFNETMAHAGKFMELYPRSTELKQTLEISGLGDHPEFVRLTAYLGKMMSDDTGISTRGAKVNTTAAEDMYPDDQPKK